MQLISLNPTFDGPKWVKKVCLKVISKLYETNDGAIFFKGDEMNHLTVLAQIYIVNDNFYGTSFIGFIVYMKVLFL